MVRELIERANGWAKVFVTAILAAAIPVVIGFVGIGGTLKQVDINTKRLDYHLDSYTHETDRDLNAAKAKLAVTEEKAIALEKRLEHLQAQNDEILRLLRRQSR